MSVLLTGLRGQRHRWRAEHGEPPTEEAVWDLHRLEQKAVAAETWRLEKAEADAAGETPIPPSMVTVLPGSSTMRQFSILVLRLAH